MKKNKFAKGRWLLAILSAGSLLCGILAIVSCGGEGGPVSGGGGGGGGGTGLTAQFLALLPHDQVGSTFVGAAACKDCHNGTATATANNKGGSMKLAAVGTSPEPIYDEWHDTLHAGNKVSCENCHGPGSLHTANPTKTNILRAAKATDPVVCAQCHGKIYDDWSASKHRQLIPDPVESTSTNPASGRTSRCIVCHSGLFRVETYEKTPPIDPANMSDQDIRDLANATLTEVSSIATCVTCHDPHKKTGKLTGNGKEVQLRHETFNTDTSVTGPGTQPAGFTNFDHICAECHNGRGANPSDAALTSGTSRPSVHSSNQYNMLMGFGGVEGAGLVERNTAHATAPGQCSHCHMPNARHTFTTSYDISCAPCHTAADAAARVSSVKGIILDGLYAQLIRMQGWSQATFGDPDLWDYTSNIVAEGKVAPKQNLIPIEMKRARHNYFFIIRDACFGPHNAPYAEHLLTVANDNLDQIGAPAMLSMAVEGRSATAPIASQAYELQVLKAQLARWERLEHEQP